MIVWLLLVGIYSEEVTAKLFETVIKSLEQWPDLLPFLFQSSRSQVLLFVCKRSNRNQESSQRSLSIGIISELAVNLGADQFRKFLQPIFDILDRGFNDTEVMVGSKIDFM